MRHKRKDNLLFDIALALPCTNVFFEDFTIMDVVFLAAEIAVYTALSGGGGIVGWSG